MAVDTARVFMGIELSPGRWAPAAGRWTGLPDRDCPPPPAATHGRQPLLTRSPLASAAWFLELLVLVLCFCRLAGRTEPPRPVPLTPIIITLSTLHAGALGFRRPDV